MRASEVMLRNAAELASVETRLEDDLGRKPTDEELTDETGWNAKTLAEIRKSAVASVGDSAFQDDDEGEGAGSPGLIRPSTVPYAAEAVYMGLNDRDKAIFDAKTGLHGNPQTSGTSLADMFKLSPAAISQRSAAIGRDIANMAGRM